MSCFHAQTTYKHHIDNRTAKKLLTQLFGFGLAHAPEQLQGLDRKNTIVGKVRGKAGTANNKRFGTMAGVPRVTIY